MIMEPETEALVKAYAAPVPRYTSYPTAPHFTNEIGAPDYAGWLEAVPDGARLSLYMHIPFCHALCNYCGCNTKASKRYEPAAEYLSSLEAEITNVGALLPHAHLVSHMHWGGGSPNFLTPDDIRRLAAKAQSTFRFAPDTEFAVELDPRYLATEQVTAFHECGVTRVSFGVQDFDEAVQVAINRMQSYDMTRDCIAQCREAGISSINIDLIYGLPEQTEASISRTVEQVISLSPDRIAIFGYAHLPARFKHQGLIRSETLPGPVERFRQARRAAAMLAEAGYVAVGIDHFAKPEDALGGSGVRRNFQGYTTDPSDLLIGLGASSIGQLPQGYVQNTVARGDYARRIAEHGLATVRGKALTLDDRIRAHVIERLMCDLTFNTCDLKRRFGDAAEPVIAEAKLLVEADTDGIVERTPSGFRVTDYGRPFTRSVCSVFDRYLHASAAMHSSGV